MKLIFLIVLCGLFCLTSAAPADPRKGRVRVTDRSIDAPKSAKNVKDAYQAERYLEHFGYLNTASFGDNSVRIREQSDLEDAIVNFQRIANIPETGKLDGTTIEWMNKPRCGLTDVQGTSGRAKRYALQGTTWPNKDISFKITKYSRDLSQEEIKETVKTAFHHWTSVTPLRITETSGRPDIEIRFESGNHNDGSPFDGPYGTLAHAYFPYGGQPGLAGDAHFDDGESWTLNTRQGVNMLSVAVHEFGHSLGLLHSDVKGSIMWPYSTGYDPNLRLHNDDITAIQQLYGKSGIDEQGSTTTRRTTTTTTTTTPRPPPPSTPPTNPLECSGLVDAVTVAPNGQTYAFRGKHAYAMDDQYTFTSPKRITQVFTGLPNNFEVDAAFEMKTATTTYLYLIRSYRVYKLNANLKVMRGYPKSINAEFKIPLRKVDAAFIWGRNGKLYLFKGTRYYRYTIGKGVDSGYPKPVSSWDGGLNYLGSAMTWINGRTYFFKGENYYRYDDNNFEIDAGYPKATAPIWFSCTPGSIQAQPGNGSGGNVITDILNARHVSGIRT